MFKQQLKISQTQTLSPQQIQLMKLIESSVEEFEQRVKEELEDNMVLEELPSDGEEKTTIEDIVNEELNFDNVQDDETPNYQVQNYYQSNNHSDRFVIPEYVSLQHHLENQLSALELSVEDFQIASFLVGCVGEDGYIRFTTDEICDDLAFRHYITTTPEHIEKIFKNIIHKLEPVGIGARNIKECILIQLHHTKQTPIIKKTINVIKSSFELFTKKHYEKLMSKHKLHEEELKEIILEIERLNPKPGNAYVENPSATETIIPDFYLRVQADKITVELNATNVPQLYVSDKYKDMIDTYNKSDKKDSQQKEIIYFVKQKIDTAKWFIDAINQRRNTLMTTMNAILEFQRDYFLSGDDNKLKPMVLKDIANMINMDISTISRVTSSKYVDTPYGIKKLKEFFSEGIKVDNKHEISNISIKSTIQEIVVNEDKKHPYTDDDLTKILKEKGMPIARRTVSKYRENLDIPVARLRKEL